MAAKLGKCCPNEISPFVEIYYVLVSVIRIMMYIIIIGVELT